MRLSTCLVRFRIAVHLRTIINSRLTRRCSALAAILLVSCTATKLKHSSKAPDYNGGPVGTVAVIAVDERLMLRQVIEGQFAAQLRAAGESAVTTSDLLSLAEIKADKEAAAANFPQIRMFTVARNPKPAPTPASSPSIWAR